MPKLRVMSGKNIVKILECFNFKLIKQNGSHIKLRRIVNGCKQTAIVPNHKVITKGTLKDIYNQSLKYIDEDELRKHFYNV